MFGKGQKKKIRKSRKTVPKSVHKSAPKRSGKCLGRVAHIWLRAGVLVDLSQLIPEFLLKSVIPPFPKHFFKILVPDSKLAESIRANFYRPHPME